MCVCVCVCVYVCWDWKNRVPCRQELSLANSVSPDPSTASDIWLFLCCLDEELILPCMSYCFSTHQLHWKWVIVRLKLALSYLKCSMLQVNYELKKCYLHARLTFAALAFLMVMSCWAITDKTSMSIRLNSSKQHQAPDCARPLKKRPIIWNQNNAVQLGMP